MTEFRFDDTTVERVVDGRSEDVFCSFLTVIVVNMNTSPLTRTAPPSPASQRQEDVLSHIRERGSVTIGGLARRFSVSEMTVRRTLHRLDEARLIIRTPGGAMPAPQIPMQRAFLERAAKMSSAKDALGRAAAALVRENETVVLDSGTTAQCIARHLACRQSLVVITPSLAVLEELAARPGVQVRLTGGVYRRAGHDLCGGAVEEALGNVHGDWAFFGAAGLSFNKGCMNDDPDMPKAILKAGRKSVLVLDSSKIGTEAAYRFCPIERCDLIITDKAVKAADLKRLSKLTRVLIAK